MLVFCLRIGPDIFIRRTHHILSLFELVESKHAYDGKRLISFSFGLLRRARACLSVRAGGSVEGTYIMRMQFSVIGHKHRDFFLLLFHILYMVIVWNNDICINKN